MLVPADMRRALGLAVGDPVLVCIVDGELRVRPVRKALAIVQARLRAHIGADAGLSDDLIADRKQASEQD